MYNATIILLLLSPDFMASEFYYSFVTEEALTDHLFSETRLIPIILRPVDWEGTPLGKFQALPKGGQPITSWPGPNGYDKAFLEVALGIRDVITGINIAREEFEKRRRNRDGLPRTPKLMSSAEVDHAIAEVQATRASVYHARQNYEEALAIYEQALLLNPHDIAVRGKGDTLQALQRYTEALVAYEQALLLDPDDAVAYRSKGDVMYKIPRLWGALDAYEQALRVDPNDSAAYRGKGDTLQALRRSKEALDAYEQALRLDPNDALAAQRKADLAEARTKRREPRKSKTNGKQENNPS